MAQRRVLKKEIRAFVKEYLPAKVAYPEYTKMTNPLRRNYLAPRPLKGNSCGLTLSDTGPGYSMESLYAYFYEFDSSYYFKVRNRTEEFIVNHLYNYYIEHLN